VTLLFFFVLVSGRTFPPPPSVRSRIRGYLSFGRPLDFSPFFINVSSAGFFGKLSYPLSFSPKFVFSLSASIR